MQAKKSFLELFVRAVSTFKNSFWGIVLTYCFAVPIAFVLHYIISSYLYTPWQQIGAHQPVHLSPFLVILTIIMIISNFYGSILLETWQTLVIKSNMFTGLSNLFESLKKSFLKALQVCLVLIVFILLYGLVAFITVNVPACAKKFFLLFLIPFIPFIMMLPICIILQDGKFINVLTNSITVCISNYFKILGYLILLFVMYIIAILLVMAFFTIFKFLLPFFLFIMLILGILTYLSVQPFLFCFMSELYFDLVTIEEERPLEDLTELSKSYPDVVDVNQTLETLSQDITQPSQQEQPIHKNETPKGLHQLGGDYEDNNKQ